MAAPFSSPLVFRHIRRGDEWNAGILKVSALPISAREEADFRAAAQILYERLETEHRDSVQEVFFQFHAFNPGHDVELLMKYGPNWMPDFGLGIWPEREPPRLWTKEEFEEMEVGSMRPMMYKACRITADDRSRRHAWDTMLGRGHLLLIGVSDPVEFFKAERRVFQPSIQERLLASFPFYVPFLTASVLVSSPTIQLDAWLPFVRYYLRESAEDQGLLVISQKSLTSLLAGFNTQEVEDSLSRGNPSSALPG
jgi:hypothetical protein